MDSDSSTPQASTPQAGDRLSIMVSDPDGKGINFVDVVINPDGPIRISYGGQMVQCTSQWTQTWVRGTPLAFPTKTNPGWYFDILRQYTRISGANVGAFLFSWDKNDMPVFTCPDGTSADDQALFRSRIWLYLYDAAMKSLTPDD